MAETFGDLLRRFRVAASLTQEALADQCGLSPATIAALEQGRRRAPRLSTVRMIAGALDLAPADLGALARAASEPPAPLGVAVAAVPGGAGPKRRDAPDGNGRVPALGALPSPLTPLFGRHADVGALTEILATQRLVTLVGPGGVGKTRLAIAVAGQVLDRFTGGTFWIELGRVSDPRSLPALVLRSLGATEQPAVPIREQLLAALPGLPALLVIDNCEHVLGEAAPLIADLLGHREITVLATSREPLAVPSEMRWAVPALTVPGLTVPGLTAAGGTAHDEPGSTAAGLIGIDSVAMFAERAARADPSFTLTDELSEAAVRVCRRLEGIPLAIEIAAARLTAVPLAQLARELDAEIPLTAGAARGVPARQTTLWASIDWSYRLLTAEDQAAFRCLACFAVSFEAEAFAAVVARATGVDAGSGLRTLARLTGKSLVSADPLSGRCRVLETIRAFAAEQAGRAGELTAIKDAHADHYASWLSGLNAADASDEALDRLDTDYANVRAALVWSIDTDSARAPAMVAAMGVAWHQRGRFDDALVLGDGALGVAGIRLVASAEAVGAIALARLLGGDGGFRETVTRAAATARVAGDRLTEGWCRFVLGMRPSYDGEQLTAAYELAAAAGSPILAALAAGNMANPGADAARQQWIEHAATFVGRVDNATHNAFYEIARADTLFERGQAVDAVDCVPVAFDDRVSPTTRLLGTSRTLLMALYLQDTGLAAVASAMSDAVARVWPVGGSWQASTWAALRAIMELWQALLDGGPPPVLGAEELERGVQSCLTPCAARTAGRAAIDHPDRIEPATLHLHPVPLDPASLLNASLVAVEAARATLGGDDELAARHWSAVLEVAARGDHLLLVCDALEGLGCLAARRADLRRAAPLLRAAARCREDIGYRWRFGFERRLLAEAWAATGEPVTEPAGPEAAGPEAAGPEAAPSWRAAADLALER
jgi:predicted ATPase/transcriptional regulator with XRE-family HTH domain